MTFFLKLIGVAVLAAAVILGVAVWDLARNGGGLFLALAGRDSLVRDCTPVLTQNLIGRGFSPVDLAFGDSPAITSVGGSFGRARSLTGTFSFSDGDNGPRVDGRALCKVSGPSVDVDVEVDSLPRRVT